ncbi:MAG TPA: LPS export ABC transporter permease LptG [Pseudolabrys sp.]|nr:LPS export ABC transporter permease LptG [Pseudolabrys sp.]
MPVPTLGGTLARYFGLRFLAAVLLVFISIFALVALIDYIEMMRRAGDMPNVSPLLVAETSLYRVPQIIERVMPFCILIGAMWSYLDLSRRLELVIARSAGMSAWQFITPAVIVAFLIGVFATTVYNPVSAVMQEHSKKLQAELFGRDMNGFGGSTGGGFWANQKTNEGQAIINAKSSRDQGVALSGVTVFTFGTDGTFQQRIEARAAVLDPGVWKLLDARVYRLGQRPLNQKVFELKTSLTPEQVRESFATPETVPFWDLPAYIKIAEHAGLVAAGYRFQFEKLITRPFMFVAMVFLAAAVSLRFFRFGGVQKMVLSGVGAGFLLYVLSKVTEDLSKAELMHPLTAAWLPVLAGGLTGFIALLYQEDG